MAGDARIVTTSFEIIHRFEGFAGPIELSFS